MSLNGFSTHMRKPKVLVNLRGAQGIIRLRQKVGDQRLEAACERALAFSSQKYGTINGILANLRYIAPWAARSPDPEHGFDKPTIVGRRSPRIAFPAR